MRTAIHFPFRIPLRRTLGAAAALLALALSAWFTLPASASPFVIELKSMTPEILEYCQAQGWKNVGVLNFRVKIGEGDYSWHTGQLNSIMAARLENVLILFNDPCDPIGITRNAGEAALKQFDKDISYLSEAGRKKLLEGNYPMAWGEDKVKVDAFLSGEVLVSADYTQSEVRLVVFDRKNLDLRPLPIGEDKKGQFKIATDLATLSDMSINFAVTSREYLTKPAFPNLKKPEGKFSDMVDLKVHYNDKSVDIAEKAKGQYELPTPNEGGKVYFTLAAKKEPLAVVLLVNGVNTFLEESGRKPDQFSKWVLEKPGETYEVRGFHTDTEMVKPFEVVPEHLGLYYPLEDSAKLGRIELFVFRNAEAKLPQPDPTPSLQSNKETAKTLPEAKKTLLAVPPVKRGIIVPSKNAQKSVVHLVDFPNPIQASATTITYFDGKKQ